MSICDNTTVNQETTLKLQSIRKTKTCRDACKKTFNDPRIRRITAVLYKKSTAVSVPSVLGTGTADTWYRVPVPVLKKYRGTFVHGTAHHCISSSLMWSVVICLLITLVNTIFQLILGNLGALNSNLVLVFAHHVTFLRYENLIFLKIANFCQKLKNLCCV